MATDTTGTSLRESSRLLVRLAEAALAASAAAFIVLVVSGVAITAQLSEFDPSHLNRTEQNADGEDAARPHLVVDRPTQTALSVVKWCLPVALLAGIGAALTAHRAAELTDAETSRRFVHLRRPAR